MNVDVQLLGQYDFDNFTLLNALMSEENRINTVIHEYTLWIIESKCVWNNTVLLKKADDFFNL